MTGKNTIKSYIHRSHEKGFCFFIVDYFYKHGNIYLHCWWIKEPAKNHGKSVGQWRIKNSINPN